MKILYAVPIAKRYRAMEYETRLAAEHGHEVHLVADYRPYWQRHEHDLDERVTVHWSRSGDLTAGESAFVTWGLVRGPRGVLRRMRRGALQRPAGKALQIWNRKVANKIEKRRKRRNAQMRQRDRRELVLALLDEHRFDWLVLGEPGAIDLLADDLPGLLDRRPDLRTTYSYEEFIDEEGPSDR